MKTITPTELNEQLSKGQAHLTLLDVREDWETDINHLEGSIFAPMSRMSPSLLSKLPKDVDTVVICHHGIRSAQVASWLEQNGHQRVLNLSGGIDAWCRCVDPGLPQY
ncbi:rhodanese-like domain-containing protein [Spiribacter curvatus]|uniref:rhodanese-like domain-containing protein n=1 Tax=Spiribacter curvatus TaxID=1335757 RepID=UPI0003F691E2|nr:rhodanese-like domain-containing protein [Spiribacter curvatus]